LNFDLTLDPSGLNLIFNMRLLFSLLCLLALSHGASNSGVQINYPEGNQILFDPKGYLINKITFVHVVWTYDLRGPLDLLTNITTDLENSFKAEMAKAHQPIKKIATEKDVTTVWDNDSFKELYSARSLDSAVVSLVLLEMFLRIRNRLESLLTSVPEKYDFNEDSLVHLRTRRGAFDFLPIEDHLDEEFFDHLEDSALMDTDQSVNTTRDKRELLAAASLAMSMWNSYKISEIEGHIANLSSKYNHLVDATTLISKKHSQLAVDVVLMKRLVQMIVNGNSRKILATSVSASDQLKDTVDNIVSIVTSGRQRKISPRLINGDALAELFVALTRKAKELESELLISHPTDLYDVQASYGYSQSGVVFKIFCHVPLAGKTQKLALLEHVKFPLAYQSQMANATITPDPGPDKFLAVLPVGLQTTSSGHRYRVLNEAELQSCFKIREYYLCSGRNVLMTNIGECCVGSLWLRKNDLISKNCELKVEPLHEAVAKLSPRSWLVFSPEPRSISISCGKNIIQSLRFEHQTRINLVEGCDIALGSHLLSTDANVLFDFQIQTHEWRYYGNIFTGLTETPENVNQMIDEITATKGKYGLKDLSHLKHYFEASSNHLSEIWKAISSLKLFSWFGNIYTFFVYVLIIWLCYIALVRGWFKKLFCPVKKRTHDLPVMRPIRTPIIRYRAPSARILDDLEAQGPPPYASIVDPSAPLMGNGQVCISSDTSSNDACNIKLGRNQKLCDFQCHAHDPIYGCTGVFRKRSKKSSDDKASRLYPDLSSAP